MRVNERSVVIILVGILLGILIFSFCCINASADEKGFSKNSKVAEQEYKKDIKSVLGEFHVSNAGVTMSKELHDGVNVTYSVVIHISAYKNFDNVEKEQLLYELGMLEIDVDNAKVNFSFS